MHPNKVHKDDKLFVYWAFLIPLRETVQLCAGGIIIPSARTVVKFINKSSLLLLLLNRLASDETIAEICSNADC